MEHNRTSKRKGDNGRINKKIVIEGVKNMEVIGVGYGRTGTDSLRIALNMLGYKTFHTKELLLQCPFTIFDRLYNEIYTLPYYTTTGDSFSASLLSSKSPSPSASSSLRLMDWIDLLTNCYGYTATTDFPLALYVDELYERYPNAKYILTTHMSSEDWYRSWTNHVGHLQLIRTYSPWLPYLQKIEAYTRWIISGLHGGDPSFLLMNNSSSSSTKIPKQNKQLVIESYEQHNEHVRTLIPADQLLDISVNEMNWNNLCEFLDKPKGPTNNTPFPNTNSTFQVKMICWTIIVVSNSLLCLMLWWTIKKLMKLAAALHKKRNMDPIRVNDSKRTKATPRASSSTTRTAAKEDDGQDEDTGRQQGQQLQITPIGVVRSIYRLCVGTPRQGLLAPGARGRIELFQMGDASPAATVDGLQGYNYIWVIFIFHLNTTPSSPSSSKFQNNRSSNSNNKRGRFKSKIAPPALGGQKVGIFATRSPHRYNPIGITLCKLDKIEKVTANQASKKKKKYQKSDDDSTNKGSKETKNHNKSDKQQKNQNGVVLHVSGLDLVDGTPVVDIKPYVHVYDSVNPIPLTATNENNKSGGSKSDMLPPPMVPHWVEGGLATSRPVVISDDATNQLQKLLDDDPYALDFYQGPDALPSMLECIRQVLAIDVRSSYQTQKVRLGKSQAERSRRVQQAFVSSDGQTSSSSSLHLGIVSSVSATGVSNDTNEDEDKSLQESLLCTQQLDNLLISFRVEGIENGHNTWVPAQNSGAEDVVVVEKIELLSPSS